MPVVMQIVRVALHENAKDQLSARAWERASEWLTHWTPQRNFQAVYAKDIEEALQILKDDLAQNLTPSWMMAESQVYPHHFTFEVSYQEIESNRFWMPSSPIWCKTHEIPKR